MTNPKFSLMIEYLSVAELRPEAKNPRKHSKSQIKALSRAISEFGFTSPILIDKDRVIVAGHCRYEAARALSIDTVPVVRLEHLTPAQVKAYRIADNRLAELAEWDMGFLKDELQSLSEMAASFDLTLTGFEMPKIDLILNPVEPEELSGDLDLPEVGRPVTKEGDLFILGEHRIFCGDALKPESYSVVMGDERADLVFTDPPYNVPTVGHILKDNKYNHEDFSMAAGEMSEQQFEGFLQTVLQRLQIHSKNGSLHFVCMDWRHIATLLAAGCGYKELKNICIWNKTNGGMGSLYRSKYEMIALFKNGTEPHINNIELGKHGRYRTNVWDYAGQTAIHTRRDKELAMHPTVKPVEMIADAILDCSNRGSIVLDPFGGSGSTLIAAEKMHRKARLIELEPRYVDVTIKRWQKLTGKGAIQVTTGQAFDALEISELGSTQ